MIPTSMLSWKNPPKIIFISSGDNSYINKGQFTENTPTASPSRNLPRYIGIIPITLQFYCLKKGF